jgi:hypothetical protein
MTDCRCLPLAPADRLALIAALRSLRWVAVEQEKRAKEARRTTRTCTCGYGDCPICGHLEDADGKPLGYEDA